MRSTSPRSLDASVSPAPARAAAAAEHLAKVLRIAGSDILEPSFSLPLAGQAFEPGTDAFRDPANTDALTDLVSALRSAARPALAVAS